MVTAKCSEVTKHLDPAGGAASTTLVPARHCHAAMHDDDLAKIRHLAAAAARALHELEGCSPKCLPSLLEQLGVRNTGAAPREPRQR